jgi:hypothetical protein
LASSLVMRKNSFITLMLDATRLYYKILKSKTILSVS